VIAVATLIAANLLGSPGTDRKFEYRYPGLEGYEIRGTYDVDAGLGIIQSKTGSFSIALALGPMVVQSIPPTRRAGLRWMKTETLGSATLRYGLDVRQKQLEATILGAQINSVVNLAGSPSDQNRFLEVARALATSQCRLIRAPHD
jgi:hypothetical protein